MESAGADTRHIYCQFMTHERESDPIWHVAWSWVQRQHDRENFDDSALAELVAWLKADPLHRQAYNKASRLWLLSGLVPPKNDVGASEPDCDAGR